MCGDSRPIYMMLHVELWVSHTVAVQTVSKQGDLFKYCELNGLAIHSVGSTIQISGRIVVGHKVSVNGREYTKQGSEPEWIVADLIGLSGEPRQVHRFTLAIK